MSKTRFITQKVIVALLMVASFVTLVPFFVMIIEHLVWIKEADDSLLNALVGAVTTKYSDIDI